MTGIMASVIAFVLSNATVILFIVGLVTAAVSIWLTHRRRALTAVDVWGALLNQFLLFSVGVSYLYNFVLHSVFGDFTAEVIGWEQSPFQLEVAFASLGFSLVGFLAFPTRQGPMVKLAALLGPAVFLLGAAGGHIYQIIASGNLALGNAGSILYTDILLPVIGFVFFWGYARALHRARRNSPVPASAASD